MKAAQQIGKNIGFDIDNDAYGYILSNIGHKNPRIMNEEFGKFASLISYLDRKLDKKPLAGDQKWQTKK